MRRLVLLERNWRMEQDTVLLGIVFYFILIGIGERLVETYFISSLVKYYKVAKGMLSDSS